MSQDKIEWEEDALKLLEKIPSFVRSMARKKIENEAIAAGLEKVTVAFIESNRAKLMR